MSVVSFANGFALSHLSLLLLCTFAVANYYPPAKAPHPSPHHHHRRHHHHHHHYRHPPTPTPTYPSTPPPSLPPTIPPTYPSTPPPCLPPTIPPSYPSTPPLSRPHAPPLSHPPDKPLKYLIPRKMVAVQGVVYCKSCKLIGVDTLIGAAPLAGAVVRLRCNNTKYELVEQTRTDKNGYFLFMPLKLSTMAFHKCRVHLVSSPMGNCSVPTNFHGGVSGAALVPSPTPPAKPVPVQFFNVGPFAFEPHKILPCRHY